MRFRKSCLDLGEVRKWLVFSFRIRFVRHCIRPWRSYCNICIFISRLNTYSFAFVQANIYSTFELDVGWFGELECFEFGGKEISIDSVEVFEQVRIHSTPEMTTEEINCKICNLAKIRWIWFIIYYIGEKNWYSLFHLKIFVFPFNLSTMTNLFGHTHLNWLQTNTKNSIFISLKHLTIGTILFTPTIRYEILKIKTSLV